MSGFSSYLTVDRSESSPHTAIGLVSADETKVTPLLYPNYRPVTNLRSLIEQWNEVSDSLLLGRPEEDIVKVHVLPPLPGRDILCVGKNYKAHAVEFAQSGYDSSDVKEQPDFPVIFTKRSTAIVPSGAQIYPHPDVTQTLDYEGELAIIIGKGGLGIKREDAWEHVWGACIVNDFTARERQRDHKQFYIGKSLDTFCPMGPYAVPSSQLDWDNMVLETRVNGKTRQRQNTSELIFDIPTLIETCSMGITLQPGDVIATGTPAGVCLSSGKFLQPGDKIEISITGLGTLHNVVAPVESAPPVLESFVSEALPNDSGLIQLPSGPLHVYTSGSPEKPAVIFIHGLGGWHANYLPLIAASGIAETHRVIAFDLEGLGLSPATGTATIDTYAESVRQVLDYMHAPAAVVVGHSMGGLVATTFAARYPDRVAKLFLIGPVRAMAEAGKAALAARAETVRKGGMVAVAAAITAAGTSAKTQSTRPLATGSVFASLMSQPSEGYASACLALAGGVDPDYGKITAPVCIVAGEEDKTSPKATTEFLQAATGAKVVDMPGVGHWHLLEDVEGLAGVFTAFVAS